jgi:transcriptional regulator with XRE-family HTH domain
MTTGELETVARVREALGSGLARAVRLTARVSLAEAARSAGVAAPTLLRWERGELRPRAAHALAYARVLACLQRELSL